MRHVDRARLFVGDALEKTSATRATPCGHYAPRSLPLPRWFLNTGRWVMQPVRPGPLLIPAAYSVSDGLPQRMSCGECRIEMRWLTVPSGDLTAAPQPLRTPLLRCSDTPGVAVTE